MTTRKTTRPLVVRLDDELTDKLSEEARISGQSVSSVATAALEKYLLSTK